MLFRSVKADYFLLVENLMDLSHVAFTHLNSIGSAEDIDPDLHWERGEDFARGTRLALNLSPSRNMVQRGITYNMDVKKVMTFLPPCHVVIDITRQPPATAPNSRRPQTRIAAIRGALIQARPLSPPVLKRLHVLRLHFVHPPSSLRSQELGISPASHDRNCLPQISPSWHIKSRRSRSALTSFA